MEVLREITDKEELKDYECWKKQLKLIGGHLDTDGVVNVYTNYINRFVYMYNHDFKLIKVVIK